MDNYVDNIIEHFGKVIIVKMTGKFYLGNIQQVEELWNRVIENDPSVIGIDCKNLLFVDSSAIGTLVKFLNNTEKDNIQMVFIDISKSIISIFKRAKLNTIFRMMNRDSFERDFLNKQ